jgi:hypothetical protein
MDTDSYKANFSWLALLMSQFMTPLKTASELLIYIKPAYAINEHYDQEGLQNSLLTRNCSVLKTEVPYLSLVLCILLNTTKTLNWLLGI